MNGFEFVSGFSRRGPTIDSRTKPDIIAPGEYIVAAGARLTWVGECDPFPPVAPVLGGNLVGLTSKRGTSFAAAIVWEPLLSYGNIFMMDIIQLERKMKNINIVQLQFL